MGFAVGDSVGPYRITAAAGRGGMGRVFRAEHAITGRVEAVKVLLEGRANEEQAARFLREIQVQAGLSHPNIAAVYNAFWADDQLVMVMEWVEGESLEEVLARGQPPLRTAIEYTRQMLAALGYAHARGVTHRDIKPGNIRIEPDGTVKLTDFGLAKTAADRRLTQSGAVVGSSYYMSPEQVRGLATLDARADLYSLGVVLYEMATGRKPFESENLFDLMAAHVSADPAPPLEVNPAVPPELNDVILKALAKDPAKRFRSAEEFRAALEGVGLPPSLRRSRRGAIVAVAGAAICILLLAGAWHWLRVLRPPEPPAAVPPQARPEVVKKKPEVPALTIPKGAPLLVRMTATVSTGTHKAGDVFDAVLDQPLMTGGRLVAARGSRVEGRILEARPGGRVVGRARLAVELIRLHVAGGRAIEISTKPVEQQAGGVRARIVFLKRGAAAVLPADTVLRFELSETVRVGSSLQDGAGPSKGRSSRVDRGAAFIAATRRLSGS